MISYTVFEIGHDETYSLSGPNSVDVENTRTIGWRCARSELSIVRTACARNLRKACFVTQRVIIAVAIASLRMCSMCKYRSMLTALTPQAMGGRGTLRKQWKTCVPRKFALHKRIRVRGSTAHVKWGYCPSLLLPVTFITTMPAEPTAVTSFKTWFASQGGFFHSQAIFVPGSPKPSDALRITFNYIVAPGRSIWILRPRLGRSSPRHDGRGLSLFSGDNTRDGSGRSAILASDKIFEVKDSWSERQLICVYICVHWIDGMAVAARCVSPQPQFCAFSQTCVNQLRRLEACTIHSLPASA